MTQFEDYVYHKAREGLLSIRGDIAPDIYALSFYYWNDEDDSRRAMLTVGYNTKAHWLSCSPEQEQQSGWPKASSSEEAKWNFAFWLQDMGTTCVIGDAPEDGIVRRRWIESLGLWFSDKEADEDFDRCNELGTQILKQFVRICRTVAKRLHDNGNIIAKFGRPIPIIVHELEYYEVVAEATSQANPRGLSNEFQEWVHSL